MSNGNRKKSIDGHHPNWGGPRIPGLGKKSGRPLGVSRPAHTVNLPLRIKEIGQLIARELGYRGWGYAIEEALLRYAEELGIEID